MMVCHALDTRYVEEYQFLKKATEESSRNVVVVK